MSEEGLRAAEGLNRGSGQWLGAKGPTNLPPLGGLEDSPTWER